jgi:pimeloyl-ACP methyl ester carboxylesterase
MIPTSTRSAWRLLAWSLALVLLGGSMAALVQTDFGDVSVRDVRFNTTEGRVLSGLLYVPDTATVESPAPAVLTSHGYVNARETQGPFAIELARRGYVVLALDQTGHGYSDPPAFAEGFGGPAGLAYLRSLGFVDLDNIGLSGHSMGTWAALAAAATYPDGYRSFVIQSSAPGVFGTPPGTADFPRNTAVLFSEWEEFSALFWGTPVPSDAMASESMMALFDTDAPVQDGVLYGSIEDGTARMLHIVRTTHPGLHWNPTATSLLVDWFDQTLDGATPASGQTWWLKEIGTLLAMIGGILFVFAAGSLLLRTPFFLKITAPVPAARGLERGARWWSGAAVATAVPALFFFYFLSKGSEWIEPSRLFPQQITNGVMVWGFAVAAAVVVLMGSWHLFMNRKQGATLSDYGLATSQLATRRVIDRAILLAATIGAGVWGLLYMSEMLFQTDFRFWIYQLHLMDALHLRIFLAYLVPFAVIFTIIAAMLHGQFRAPDREVSLAREMVTNALVLVTGITVLIGLNYLPLLLGGTLWIDTQPLLAIVAGFQFIPILAIVAAVSTYFFRLTGTVYTGAFLSAVFVTWTMAAGTATQYPIQAWDGGGLFVRVGLPIALGLGLVIWAITARSRVVTIPELTEEEEAATAEEEPRHHVEV